MPCKIRPLLVFVLILASGCALQHAPSPAAPRPVPAELAGTWLVVTRFHPVLLQSPKHTSRYSNSLRAFRFTRDGSTWQVQPLTVSAPASLLEQMDKANRAGSAFEPDPEAIGALANSPERLQAAPPQGDIKLLGPDTPLSKRSRPEDKADFHLVINTKGENVAAAGTTYSATSVSRDRISGKVALGQIAALGGPLILPMGMQGNFTMYRLQ